MELSHASGNTPSNGRTSPTVSVVIPTLNEERNLPHVFAKLPDGITEVILVDGGSVDRTVEVARELRPDVVDRAADPYRQGQRPGLRLRRLHRRHHRDDRRRRLDRPGRDPAVRRRSWSTAPTSSRARASPTAATATTSPSCASSATTASTWWSTSCSGPASPTSATATTRSGAASCRSSTCRTPALPRPGRRQQALGRRLRDRDDDQHPGRGRRHEGRRGRQRRARAGSTARATSTPSATASGCCAPSSASTAGCAAAPRRRRAGAGVIVHQHDRGAASTSPATR